MNNTMNIDEVAALYGLGRAKGEDLVAVALRAMESGLKSDNLHCLAGLTTKPPLRDAGPVFEATLSEFGKRIPTGKEAALIVAKYHARKIISGKMSPADGVFAIAQLWEDADRSGIITPFVAMADDLDETMTGYDQAEGNLKTKKENELKELNEQIFKATRRLLSDAV
jgi:hypothetical protein